MNSTSQGNRIPFKDALDIFWNWRQAAISVEVCFFCRRESSESVRVSVDGVVRLVDPEEIVTISGDGREIDLDLRDSEIRHARELPGGLESLNPLDPDSILQVNFPNGEVCLVFPYRRVGHSRANQQSVGSELEAMQNMGMNTVEQDRRTAESSRRFFKMSANGIKQVKKRRTGKTGPPIFPVAAFLVVFVFLSLALTPSNVPKLLVELGVPQKLSDPNTFVWVIPQEGNYYCSGSVLAGRRPGKQMKQADALMFGYQPALGHYCGDGVSGKSNDQAGLMDDYETLRHGGEAIIARLMQISRSWVAGSYGRLVQSSSMLLFPSSRGFFRESPE